MFDLPSRLLMEVLLIALQARPLVGGAWAPRDRVPQSRVPPHLNFHGGLVLSTAPLHHALPCQGTMNHLLCGSHGRLGRLG